jgi:hypothetical protein
MVYNIEEIKKMNKNIGDMSKEELYELCNELLDKDTDYMLIQRRIDKAIEYIKSWVLDEYSIAVIDKKDDDCCYIEPNAREKLLEILGDKELDEESKDEKYETYTLTEDEENGTKLINGEWYRVEKK